MIGYLNPGATFYAIDTTKLPKGKAWDMESNMYQNGYKVRRMPSETVFRHGRLPWSPEGQIPLRLCVFVREKSCQSC